MKNSFKTRMLSVLLALLLIAMMVMPAACADVIMKPVGKPDVDDGQTITRTIVLQANGTIVSVTEDDVPIEGIELSELPKFEVPAHVPTATPPPNGPLREEDWEYLKTVMTDLSEKERDALISEAQTIFAGKSELTQDEQREILYRIGNYIVMATDGNEVTPRWKIQPGHWHLSTTAGRIMRYVTAAHNTTLGDYSGWADENRFWPPTPGLVLNRHSWVLDGTVIPGFDNYGPLSLNWSLNNARSQFNDYNVDEAYVQIGKGLHYIEDLGCPYHTTGAYLLQHDAYESWVQSHWTELGLDSAIDVTSHFVVTDPAASAIALAEVSHQVLPYINWTIDTDPDWQDDPYVIAYTQQLHTLTEQMTIGMLVYASKFESPDTIGPYSVPIWDGQTSYAFVDDVACSDRMRISTRISHTYIGDLEVWLGWKDDSEGVYREGKIWDRQGGSEDHLNIDVYVNDWYDVHDWRLRVKDNAAGNEGAITEFYVFIG
ncbi:MAG: hypothetical protein QMD46_05875 [Methanomicrobiales archaeon]|nr:hypothetical protein [Methanomicrobiales archaeon]MDI6876205.1 hypothetical protein [Methanomicrobiales archaeon]